MSFRPLKYKILCVLRPVHEREFGEGRRWGLATEEDMLPRRDQPSQYWSSVAEEFLRGGAIFLRGRRSKAGE